MRTKILKIGMPLMAFLLAIVFAFATNVNSKTESSTFVDGYIFSSDKCVKLTSHDCTVDGMNLCTINGQQIFSTKSGTKCENPLMRW
ncbi:MAG TPA: DUF6520 family protein [Chitinophagaceae bacterium]|nr:DUF6520 family protein [Chitinophagaceae bacterium]